MINLPKISVRNVYVGSSYKPSIFMLLDADSGPLSVTTVHSKLELLEYYNTFNNTKSYQIASKLLDIGYPLELLRVKTCEYYSSIGICNDGDVCYPIKNITYNNVQYPNRATNGDVYSLTLTFKESMNAASAYFMINDGRDLQLLYPYSNELNPNFASLSELIGETIILDPKNSSNNFDNGSTKRNAREVIKLLIETLACKLGFKYKKHNEYTYTIYNYIKFSSNILTNICTATKTYDYNEHDIETRIKYYKTPLIFYSKYETCISDLRVQISPNGSMYAVYIEKLDNIGNSKLSETYYVTFDKSDSENYIENQINQNSRLVTCNFDDSKIIDGDYSNLLGIFKFLANVDNHSEATIENFENVAKSLYSDLTDTLNSVYFIDSGINSSKYQYYLYRKLYNVNIPRLFLFTYTDSISRNFISYFDGNYIDEDSYIIYPSYITFLNLAYAKLWEGNLKSNIRLVNSLGFIDENLEINKNTLIKDDNTINLIGYDGYTYYLDNPLGYFNGELMSLEPLASYIIYSGYLREYLEFNPANYSKYNISQLIYKVSEDANKFTGYNITPLIEDITINEDSINIILKITLSYTNNKDVDILININRIIGE
jgi:hypothetical protein